MGKVSDFLVTVVDLRGAAMRASFIFALCSGVGLIAAAPATAQEKSDVAEYLCTFGGQCGETAAEPVVEKAAPATKGFRLARATTPTPAADSTRSVGTTRSVGVTRTAAAAVTRPAGAVRARPAPAAGARADLRIEFQSGSDKMTDVGIAKATGFAGYLTLPSEAAKRFLIEGHTDSVGAYDSNVDLSRRRAQAVADFLVGKGVDRARLEVKGFGPDQPLPGRSKADGANRRVEAQLLGS
jgi:outer membrane protein OmpA-like peptidoglycan-associated protein